MSPVVGNATLLGLPGAQPPPCHSGPHPGPGERDSRERLPEASPSSYACCPSCLGGHSVPTSPLLPSAEGTQHQTSLLESGSEGLHEPSFGPRPLPSLSGVTWYHKDSPYWLCPHPRPPPWDLSALLPTPGWPPFPASSPVLELSNMAGPQNVCSGDFRVQRFVKCALWSALEPFYMHTRVSVCARVVDMCVMD